MVTGLLRRGLLAGLVAGIVAFGVGRIIGEPQIERAVTFEAQLDHDRGEAREPALVSRKVQAGIGLLTASAVYGAALGGLVALVFAFSYGRAAGLGPRTMIASLALAGFVVAALAPALKYPPNPPAIGDPATIGHRTALYFVMIALSLTAGTLAIGLARRLGRRLGQWNAAVGAALAFVVVMAAIGWVLPTIDEVPDGFPAAVLWRFRIASLGVQAALWATLGIVFGTAAEKFLDRNAAARRANFGSAARTSQ